MCYRQKNQSKTVEMDFNAKRCLFVIDEESEKEEEVDTMKLEASIGM